MRLTLSLYLKGLFSGWPLRNVVDESDSQPSRQPVPFKCSITPRSEDAGRLVRETTPLVSARAT